MPTSWAFQKLRNARLDPTWHPSVTLAPEVVLQADVPVHALRVAEELDRAREEGFRAAIAISTGVLQVGDDIPREGNALANDRDLCIRVLRSIDPTNALAHHDRKS